MYTSTVHASLCCHEHYLDIFLYKVYHYYLNVLINGISYSNLERFSNIFIVDPKQDPNSQLTFCLFYYYNLLFWSFFPNL